MRTPGLVWEICSKATSWCKQSLVKTSAAHVVMILLSKENCGWLHVRPSVALNANLNRSSSNLHKICFVMCLNLFEDLRKFRQVWRHFWIGRPKPPKMAVFGTFLGVRPSVALNATLVRSSSNFHKMSFVMCLNTCEGLMKLWQV